MTFAVYEALKIMLWEGHFLQNTFVKDVHFDKIMITRSPVISTVVKVLNYFNYKDFNIDQHENWNTSHKNSNP